RVQDYDVTAHLVGPAQAPQIDLNSRPELSEIDIISLLTFGFTQFEVRDAGGSAGAAGLEVVSAYTGLDKELKRVLPEAVRKSSSMPLPHNSADGPTLPTHDPLHDTTPGTHAPTLPPHGAFALQHSSTVPSPSSSRLLHTSPPVHCDGSS